MSIKGCHLLWLKLRIEGGKFIGISIPIPLYTLQELLDCCLDLLTAICFFAPKVPDSGSAFKITIYSVKELIIIVMKLLYSLTEDESYDLINVTTGNVKVLIKIG